MSDWRCSDCGHMKDTPMHELGCAAGRAEQLADKAQAHPNHRLVSGDLFESGMQTLVNAVNCRGVMGAGIALEFRERFPEMYKDYRARCKRGEVTIGVPYVWNAEGPPYVLNFPTKDDWREKSRVRPIVNGLTSLHARYREWGIESLAVPALGCGLGGLPWETVEPILVGFLSLLPIPVQIYRPQ